MLCTSCGFDNPPNMRFCGGCGARLPSEEKPSAEERRHLTVMFCDLVESTAMSEQLDPEDLRNVVNAFQTTAAAAIERFGGHIAQYLGDGLLIYFGFPTAHEDDPTRAVRAALDILASVEQLSAEVRKDRGVELAVRIGVHAGLVVTGDVGGRARTERLAMGSVPNIAARVQSLASPGELLVTSDLHALLDADLSCSLVGPHQLKGISEPVVLFRVDGVRTQRALSRSERSDFVGREKELALVLDRYASANQGRGQIVLLTADAGLGKSRFCRELARRIGTSTTSLAYRCAAYHQNTPFFPILDSLPHLLGVSHSDSDDAYLSKLTDALAPLGITDNDSLLLLAEFLTGRSSFQAPVAGAVKRLATIGLLADLLVRLAAQSQKLLLIEDLHWADPSTVELTQHVTELAANRDVLVVISYRPTFVAEWRDRPNQITVELEPFTSEEALALVEASSDVALAADVRAQVLERADGIPLFIEELAKTVSQAESSPSDSTAVPNSLRDSLTARLDSLGQAKEVIQLAALIGRRFDLPLIAAISQQSATDLEVSIDRALQSELIVTVEHASGRRYAFRHALIQEAAYDSLLRRRRRSLHGAVADELSRDATYIDRHPELLALHNEQAERFEDATIAYKTAGYSSLARSSYLEAQHFFGRALELVPQSAESPSRAQLEYEVLLARAQTLTAISSYTADELAECYERARRMLESGEVTVDPFPFYSGYWGLHAVRCNVEQAALAADRLYESAQASDAPNRLAIARFALGCNAFYLGQLNHAMPHLDSAVSYYTSLDRSSNLTANMLYISQLVTAWCAALSGDVTRAYQELDDAINTAEKANDPFVLVQAICYACAIEEDIDTDLERILDLAEKALEIALQYGFTEWIGYARMHRAYVQGRQGDLKGMTDMQDAIANLYDGNSDNSWAQSLRNLANVQHQLQQHDAALATINQAIEVCTSLAGRYVEADCHRLRAQICAAMGDHREAEQSFERAAEIARADSAAFLQVKAAHAFAAYLQDQGRTAEALAAVSNLPTNALRGADRLLGEVESMRAHLNTLTGEHA